MSNNNRKELVKTLIILIQDFYDYNPGKIKQGHPIEADYGVTIDESNTYFLTRVGGPTTYCNGSRISKIIINEYFYTICSFLTFLIT